MKKITLSICLIILLGNTVQLKAQETEKKAITQTIESLFEGFRKSDSALVASTFFDRTPYLGTSFMRNGSFQFREDGGLEPMLNAIAKPKADSVMWDERIYDLEIKVDDGLASVFCPYQFYVGEKFSHCGVNYFTLTKTENGWKILTITDTRRKENCK
ncbi:hypothetical protein EP331_05940 [bacterium]|nr:MAG: hypothetical protein EP331_05940 [bacterium]